METADGDPIFEQRRRTPTKRYRQYIHTVANCSIKRREYVGIEALMPVNCRTAYFVGRHAGFRGTSLCSAVAVLKDIGSGDKAAACCGEGVTAMAFCVSDRGEFAQISGKFVVALVEEPCTD